MWLVAVLPTLRFVIYTKSPCRRFKPSVRVTVESPALPPILIISYASLSSPHNSKFAKLPVIWKAPLKPIVATKGLLPVGAGIGFDSVPT